MADAEASQRAAFGECYGSGDERWAFHYTSDPLTRYLRDRRLNLALDALTNAVPTDVAIESVLVVCGGVGGEGTFFRKRGFRDVTVSDFSSEALERCKRLDPALKTSILHAERMDVPDSSYDLVVVQDGLHHLPRPALGFTEMLRVARVAVVLIEPHRGVIGKLLGHEWEVQRDAVNYVFRWNTMMLEQCTRSYLLSREARVIGTRVWDHGLAVANAVRRLPTSWRFPAAKAIYSALRPMSPIGNMMVGVVVKSGDAVGPTRLTGH
ncbi:MAG: class I SAM-dependent methyltransferase [Actinomycetota bacterium]|nr:class I SAM-dependent methyltransferase [Actinomycetota bacterium]